MIDSISEFMKSVEGYFQNGFPSTVVSDRFAEKLSYVKPSSLDRLFEVLTENFPSTWTPDVKALKEAITESGIITLSKPEEMQICPVCGNTWASTGLCPKCCYNSDTDGTPDEHRQWFNDWKAGKEKRFDVHGMLLNLTSEKKVANDLQ